MGKLFLRDALRVTLICGEDFGHLRVAE